MTTKTNKTTPALTPYEQVHLICNRKLARAIKMLEAAREDLREVSSTYYSDEEKNCTQAKLEAILTLAAKANRLRNVPRYI